MGMCGWETIGNSARSVQTYAYQIVSAALPCDSKHNINNFMPSQSDRNFPGLYWGEFNSMNAFVVGLAIVDSGDFFFAGGERAYLLKDL